MIPQHSGLGQKLDPHELQHVDTVSVVVTGLFSVYVYDLFLPTTVCVTSCIVVTSLSAEREPLHGRNPQHEENASESTASVSS